MIKRTKVEEIKEDSHDSVVLRMNLAFLEFKQENYDQARIILENAIIEFRYSVDLRINLAFLEFKQENYDQARIILENAIIDIPQSVELRMQFAFAECLSDKKDKADETIERALIDFADNDFEIKPVEWIRAATMNRHEIGATYEEKYIEPAISTIFRLFTCMKEVEDCQNMPHFEETFLLLMLKSFPRVKSFWLEAIFSIEFRDLKNLVIFLKLACKNCPNDKNVRNLIRGRIFHCKDEYLLMGRYFNKVNDDYKRKLSTNKKYCASMTRINKIQEKLKCILINFSDESSSRDIEDQLLGYLEDRWLSGEEEFVRESLEKVILVLPDDIDFVMMKSQIETKKGELENAVKTYRNAIKSVTCPVLLFVQLSELEQNRGNSLEARNVLEGAKSQFPDYVEPWIASIRLEILLNDRPKAQSLLTQAMDEFPTSGELLALSIAMEERSNKGEKAAEALKICVKDEDDERVSYVMLATAKMFFSQGKVGKSRKWFNKIVELAPCFADAWVFFYKLEKLWGSEESAREILLRFSIVNNEYLVQLSDVYDNCSHYNEDWDKFRDHIDNWGLTYEELLEAIIDKENIDAGQI